MSDPTLPDDPKRWPQDPYQLLGVKPGIAPRDLKRAYGQLIRRYTPEAEPDKFRRIRDAYEQIEAELKFQGEFPQFHPSWSSPPPSSDSASEAEAIGEPQPPKTPRTSIDQELDQLWERAVAGEERTVYPLLVEQHHRLPEHRQIPLMLYWLLTMYSDLDPGRHPCDWLAVGMGPGPIDAASELYRRHLLQHPEDAFHERFHRLFYGSWPAAKRVVLASWRWQAASRLRRGQYFQRDLEFLHDQLPQESETDWAQILFLALDHLLWFEDSNLAATVAGCLQEMENIEHLHTKFGDSFARVDHLRELTSQWSSVHVAPGSLAGLSPLLDLVPASWTDPIGELRLKVTGLLEGLLSDPNRLLKLFDELVRRAPLVLVQISQMLDMCFAEASLGFHEPRQWNDLSELASKFESWVNASTYADLRIQFFEFCRREMILPATFAEALERQRSGQAKTTYQALRNDAPLIVLCQAVRVFWA